MKGQLQMTKSDQADGFLQGKVALITGASRGIGRAIAQTLAQKGLKLALNARSLDQLKEVKATLTTGEEEAVLCPGDLGDSATPIAVVKKVIDYFGQLDVLINNAGVALAKPLADTTLEEWDEQMAVNARAPFLLCREAIPYLKKSEVATIVNLSSVVGTKGYINQGAYTASKHALMGLTKVLARELHSEGIRVHVVAPGGVATDLISTMRPDLKANDLIHPQEIADIVWFLLSRRRGKAVIDEINVRRASNQPWK
ncbi:MAG: hypothetical protein PWP04_122 [Candidatus Atribacteria bacterium]|nr:hypothetical protein [Candidatus Atribacteria bacterium]